MEFMFKITEWHYDITRLNNQDSEIIICCVVFNDPAKYSSALMIVTAEPAFYMTHLLTWQQLSKEIYCVDTL
jgi:hypothetical protein